MTAAACKKRARSVRGLIASESGMAVPIVMFTMLAALALASAAVVASTASHGGTVRDERSKAAFAAAEAGVNQALLHYNRIETVAPNLCLYADAPNTPVAPAAPTANGWCEQVPGYVTGLPDSTFRYSVRPCRRPRPDNPCPAVTAGPAPRFQIVSTGTVAGVSRRIEVDSGSSVGLQPFLSVASIIGHDSVTLDSGGGATPTQVFGDVATEGNISLGSGAELNCDYAQVGEGHVIDPPVQSSCPATEGTLDLAAVNQGSAPTVNANGTISSGFQPPCLTGCFVDTPTVDRRLTIPTGSSLTLREGTYSLCKLVLASNASLYVTNGDEVTIFLDKPENCLGLTTDHDDAYVQLDMSANARMTVTGVDPAEPEIQPGLRMLFVGSTSLATSIYFSSNTVPNQECTQDFVVYAPLSSINISSNSNFCGAMAGKSIHIDSNSVVQASDSAREYELPDTVAPHYDVEGFVECIGSGGSSPDSGC